MIYLYWRPYPRGTKLDDRLRDILRKRYIKESSQFNTLTAVDINYLEGLMDAGIPDADNLIEAIRKHGEIEIFLC